MITLPAGREDRIGGSPSSITGGCIIVQSDGLGGISAIGVLSNIQWIAYSGIGGDINTCTIIRIAKAIEILNKIATIREQHK